MNGFLTMALVGAALGLGACSSADKVGEKRDETASPVAVNAAAAVNASNVAEISFEKNSAALTEGARASLAKLIGGAAANGKIDDVKVAAWADREYPKIGEKALAPAERELANQRANAVKDYLKSVVNVSDVDTYNMAQRPSSLSNLFNTSDNRVKKAMEQAGISTTGSGNITTAKASQAVVLVIMED